MKNNCYLIKNPTLVNYNETLCADVLIKDNKIEKIGNLQVPEQCTVIDATNKFLLPGGIDPHVHLNLRTPAGTSADNFFTGTKAALAGGTTTIIDFVTPQKGQSLVEAFIERKKEAKNALTNVKFHVSPIEWTQNTEEQMRTLVEQHNIKSFKIYLAYKNSIGISDNTIIKVLKTAKKLNAVVAVHCENDAIITFLREKFISEKKTSPKYHAQSRPPEAETLAVKKILLFAKHIGTTVYIVHVSTKTAVKEIKKAQKKGVNVIAETCPHYLLLDDKMFDNKFETAAKYVLSPPLRKPKDNKALWQHIENGTIKTIGTDHCPFNINGQKNKGINDFTKIPNGAGGIEHRLILLYTYGVRTKKISMQKLVEITSTNPAKIFGLEKKGIIKKGFDADLIIFNPNEKKTISYKNHIQNCDNNIFENFITYGTIEKIFLNGKLQQIPK